jgi:hypothetical protein
MDDEEDGMGYFQTLGRESETVEELTEIIYEPEELELMEV